MLARKQKRIIMPRCTYCRKTMPAEEVEGRSSLLLHCSACSAERQENARKRFGLKPVTEDEMTQPYLGG